jgi:hypothetical protein
MTHENVKKKLEEKPNITILDQEISPTKNKQKPLSSTRTLNLLQLTVISTPIRRQETERNLNKEDSPSVPVSPLIDNKKLPKLDTTLLMENRGFLDRIEERSVHNEIEPWADKDSFASDFELTTDHLKPTIKRQKNKKKKLLKTAEKTEGSVLAAEVCDSLNRKSMNSEKIKTDLRGDDSESSAEINDRFEPSYT